MDRIHLMAAFIAVGEEGSFAVAAARLGISRPAVTRAIASLEQVVGVKLLMRTTRSVRLTEAGQRYLEDIRPVMAKIAETREILAGANAAPKGIIHVTAPVLFGAAFVTPCVVDYLRSFPGMTINAYFLDRVVDIVEEGWDVALRIGPLADTGLAAVQVGQVRRVLCAAPHYLATHGTPRQPEELAQHAIVAASGVTPDADWTFGHAGECSVRIAPRLTVASNDAAIEAALLGIGLTRLLSYQVAGPLADGRLSVVLADHEEPPLPVHVLYREDRYGSAALRAFVELLVARLGRDPGLR